MSNFKVGDKVYCLMNDGKTKIYTVEQDVSVGHYPIAIETGTTFTVEGKLYESSDIPSLIHATKENYDLLCELFPNQAWEEPHKPKTPREVIQAMLDDGWDNVPVVYLENDGKECLGYANKTYLSMSATPFNPETGKQIVDYIDGNVVLGD